MGKLLRTNTKLNKVCGRYRVSGLTFAPHGLSGHQVCPESSSGCRASCNGWWSGQRVTPQARKRALADTMWFHAEPHKFKAQLDRDIWLHSHYCAKRHLIPLVRLNVASDLFWADTIKNWPHVTFYDYTKVRSRFRSFLDGKLPSNYHLTYSVSERSHMSTVASYLRAGGNVAQVFDVDYYPSCGRIGELPTDVKIWGKRWPVVDGDQHDVRLPATDGSGVVVGLRLKGTNAAKSRGRKSGFATAEVPRLNRGSIHTMT